MQIKTVGVSLLAIAVCQLTTFLLIYRYREQAHSYREPYFSLKIVFSWLKCWLSNTSAELRTIL
ncbi:hypothetical protein EMIT0232MI5_10125 [Pseudomonas sp. IT-232MI5]